MTRSEQFLGRLRAGGTMLADGATGTLLQSMGLEAGQAPEVWVLEEPERIRALYQSYVDAGSDLFLTCTFGGTRYRLESHGLADQVYEVNRRAGELARQVAGDDAFVGGDMGPTGQLLQPLGPLTAEEMTAAFAEQAAGLAAGGADFLLIETMSSLEEAQAAIAGARQATGLPIICTFSFDTRGRTMMGTKPQQVAETIGPLVEGIGANCGKDPAEYVEFVQIMRQAAPEAILWAKPNAGLPRVEAGQAVYDATPEFMADLAQRLRQAGAQVIGGCCGTTPAHISAMNSALQPRASVDR